MKPKAYEDEKGWLYIKIGEVANLQELAEELCPLNSKMTVYYNPDKPKICYVERPVSKNFASCMFIILGIVIILLCVWIFFLT